MRRPYFISESRQRLRRLAQRVEARKLQEVFSSRRAERFSRPGGAARQLHPAGTPPHQGGEGEGGTSLKFRTIPPSDVDFCHQATRGELFQGRR